MVRLLHTSDWHLGASFDVHSRERDHAAFLAWLRALLVEREVEVLVIAGDLFDLPQPSAEAQRQFYGFLASLPGTPVRRVVVVGGNHDSASRLEAPAEVLRALSVHVVGGLPDESERISRCLVPIAGRAGGIDAVVLAVPFVHEFRLGVRVALGEGDPAAMLRERMAALYRDLTDAAVALHQGAPVVATGHLACVGGERDDAPWEIHQVGPGDPAGREPARGEDRQVGTLDLLPPSVFDPRLAYVALGHLHRSFRVGASRAFYSGSPIALSVKEGRSPRRVLLVEVDGAEPRVESVEVPEVRQVLELSGSPAEVKERLASLTVKGPLPPLVQVRVEVPFHQLSLEQELRDLLRMRSGERPLLCGVQQILAREAPSLLAAGGDTRSLSELPPIDVFRALCRARKQEPDEPLLAAFREVLSSLTDHGAE